MKRAIHNYNTPDHDVQAQNPIKEKTKTSCGISNQMFSDGSQVMIGMFVGGCFPLLSIR